MDPEPPAAGCLACGACCFSHSPTFVRVTGEDWAKLGPEAERMAHFIGHRAYLRMTDGHCAALEIRAGAGGERVHYCTIYPLRPRTCRELKRGSPQCLAELAQKQDRPAAARMLA